MSIMLAAGVLGQQNAAAPIAGWVASTDQGAMSNSTSHVVTLPSGRQLDDTLLAIMLSVGTDSGWAEPSGWTRRTSVSRSAGLSITLSIFTRPVDAGLVGSAPATVTFVPAATVRWVAVCQLYRGFSSVTGQTAVATAPLPSFAATNTIDEWTGTPASMDSGDLIVTVTASTWNPVPTPGADVFTVPAGSTLRDTHSVTNGSTREGTIVAADRTATGSDTAGVWTAGGANDTTQNTATAVLVLNA